MGALAVDGPALFCWLLVLVLALLSVLLFAERHLEGGVTSFAGQAAALPGTEAEREASTKGLEHTEVFPLMMFAVAGHADVPGRPTTCSPCSSPSRSSRSRSTCSADWPVAAGCSARKRR